jgi:hypothetical protein
MGLDVALCHWVSGNHISRTVLLGVLESSQDDGTFLPNVEHYNSSDNITLQKN